MIPLSTYKYVRLVRRVFGSIIRRPEQVLVTITDVCEHVPSVTGLATTTLWRVSFAGAAAYLWSADDTASRVFDNCFNM